MKSSSIWGSFHRKSIDLKNFPQDFPARKMVHMEARETKYCPKRELCLHKNSLIIIYGGKSPATTNLKRSYINRRTQCFLFDTVFTLRRLLVSEFIYVQIRKTVNKFGVMIFMCLWHASQKTKILPHCHMYDRILCACHSNTKSD